MRRRVSYPQDKCWAHLTVLNATGRQRRSTDMRVDNFGPGKFLEQIAPATGD
jgi:hypothetical protein